MKALDLGGAGQREWLHELFDGVSVGLIVIMRDMTIEWINAAAARMLGDLTPEQMMGKGLYDVVPAMKQRAPIYRRVLEGESLDFPVAEVPMRETTRSYNVHYRPIGKPGQVSAFFVVAHEITRQEQAERELRVSEENFRTLYDATPDMLLAIELPGGKIVECNQTLCQTLGYTRDELTGRSVMEIYAPECAEQVRKNLEIVKREGRVQRSELRVRCKDGSTIDIELNSSAFHDSEGNVIGARGVWHDITERKSAVEKLRESEMQLRELSKRVLEVQEEERKRLAREFHDEVGQIFTALRLDLAWIRTRLKPGQGELQEKIRTMDALIDESIRKVRQIARTLRPDILDSEGLVAAVRGLVHDFEIHSGIETRLDAPEELVVEPAVATVVFRVIQEALTNVARHSEATLTEVRLSREENALVARVCDNGKGIDQERLATRRSLGLRGMQERAKLVGGEIVIASLKPTGTEIKARIPI